ncbi:MAG TPA: GWxTD domain-containing protein [Bryobacteraceae bacterium]|nr:GWxTD domain-containing protein [Bryobacteraceae bacterium]
MKVMRLSICCISLLSLAGIGWVLLADDQETKPAASKSSAAPRETISKPISEREKKKREEKLRKELETPYRKWINEDVAYIITDEERTTFKRLQTDDEREQFIEQFWLRRDPTPDTVENEFKEEHYRRIQYANDHFASGIPGWKTDRGRIYITFGPPDERDEHPSGGTYERPPEEGGGETTTYPFEDWRYRYIDGIGNDVNIEFVDPTMTGEYHMTMDPSEKDALTYVPGAGLSMMEQLGLADKSQRFNNTDGTHLPTPMGGPTAATNEFDRLDRFVKLQKPPAVKFKDLEAAVTSHISFNILPMKAQADFFPVTDASVLTNVTLQFENKDLQFQSKEGVQKAVVNIYGRITTMTRRVVNVFEDTVTVDAPNEMLAAYAARKSIYQKTIPLPPGTYRLNVVAKDIVSGNLNNYEVALTVPHLDPDKLASSTLVLADLIEKVPTKSIGTGPFVIGSSKVRPRLGDTFKQDEKMGIYLKLYNFEGDEKTHKPIGQVDYEVIKNGSSEAVLNFSEDIAQIPGASASQVTIEKILPLKSLAPGQYTIKVKVTDKNRNQVVTPSAQFTVT